MESMIDQINSLFSSQFSRLVEQAQECQHLSLPVSEQFQVLDCHILTEKNVKAHTKGTTGNTMMEMSLLWVPC